MRSAEGGIGTPGRATDTSGSGRTSVFSAGTGGSGRTSVRSVGTGGGKGTRAGAGAGGGIATPGGRTWACVPGGGAVLAAFAAYTIEKKVAKDPSRFGKGAIEGVAAPEAANNAAAQTSFIPLLTLGLPSNAIMALMMGAMMIQGIAPGSAVMQPMRWTGVCAAVAAVCTAARSLTAAVKHSS